MQRGDIYWVDLAQPRGSAPAERRPAVVVQADAYNASQISTVVVAAITSNTRLASMPGNVFVPATVGGLAQDSVINVTQLATVDRRYLEARIGRLPGRMLDDVNRGLRLLLALR
jgi:mRNA interferase MazF